MGSKHHKEKKKPPIKDVDASKTKTTPNQVGLDLKDPLSKEYGMLMNVFKNHA